VTPPLTSDELGTEAASTALKPNKYQSLMELLDALELKGEDEIDCEQPAPDQGGMMPRSGGGMTNGSGLMTDGEALKPLPYAGSTADASTAAGKRLDEFCDW
jgi:hypothetical protein